ncbi:MAG: 4-hydroxythreonine-4-phosphate dehydrogenase PdxA [Hyphomicrobiaceae bacterium]
MASDLGRAAGSRRPLALTMGDPAGIGLDITLQAWRDRVSNGAPPFVLYADPSAVAERARVLGIAVELAVCEDLQAGRDAFLTRLPVRPVPLAVPAAAGRTDVRNAGAIIAAIDLAVADAVAGRVSAVATNPIAKSTLLRAGFRHPGHTEYLAELAERHHPGKRWVPVMMLASETLRVVPLTVHVPIARVPALLTTARVTETVRIVAEALASDFGIARPRIAVTGLNPHAGEAGTIGREEVVAIAPAIAALQAEGLAVTGPHSADSLFHDEARKHYDAVVTMYHDQALIPIKTLAFDTAVNVTLGLPFVRTSPDHGTAFDIAGTGKASPSSLVAALKLGVALADRRAAAAHHA